MNAFDTAGYGPVLAELLSTPRRRPLDGGLPVNTTTPTVKEAFAHTTITDRDMARCCLAGLWLLYDQLDRSHTLSQGVDTPTGSFWHGVMHRREGDFGNAKYWFRRAGGHPVFEILGEQRGEAFDPLDFVDRVEQAVRTGADAEACLDTQQAEWETLFDWCYRQACG